MILDGKAFGKFLAAEGEVKGFEQKDLAVHLGISSGAISQWKKGTVPPDKLDKIVDFLGFSDRHDLANAVRVFETAPVFVVDDPIYLNELLAEIFRSKTETIVSRRALIETAKEHSLSEKRIVEALAEHPDPNTRLLASLLTPGQMVKTEGDLNRWQRLVRNATAEMGLGLEFQVVLSSLSDFFDLKDGKAAFGLDDIKNLTGVDASKVWSEVMDLPFTSQYSNAKWVLVLRFPTEEEARAIYSA